MLGGSLVGLGVKKESWMEGTALVKKRSRTGSAAENMLFPWDRCYVDGYW